MHRLSTYLAFHLETSGRDPYEDRIIQVGICNVVTDKVVDEREWLVKQDVRIQPEAEAKHGITSKMLEARGVSAEWSLVELFRSMCQAPACLGHNIHQFDVPFMAAEARRLDVGVPDFDGLVDTAALYKGWRLDMRKQPDESFQDYSFRVLARRVRGFRYSIPECLRMLGIDIDTSPLHGAAQDAYATHLIFQNLKHRI